MRDRFCWHCGHAQDKHTYAGGCSFSPHGARCDCARYEDGEYFGQNLKRDLYTYSDARRAKLMTPIRFRKGPPVPPPPPPDGRRWEGASVEAAFASGGERAPEKPRQKSGDGTRDERPPEELKMSRLEVHLAEYAALKEEINRRLDAQRQAFNYTVAVLGAFVAGAGLLAGKDSVDPSAVALVPHLLLLLPLIVGPLAFIFFDDELVLYRNIFHICLHLREEVYQEVKGAEANPKETKPFLVEAEGFGRMWLLSRISHPILSAARWILFVAPVAIPLLVYRFTKEHIREGPIKVGKFEVYVDPYSEILFWVDVVIGIILLVAIISVLFEQYTWRNCLSTDSSERAFKARTAVNKPRKNG